jgi:hypothetical protein
MTTIRDNNMMITLYKRWFVVCVYDLYSGVTRLGPYDSKSDAEAALSAIRNKGMGGGRKWGVVTVEELECVNVNGGWYALEPVFQGILMNAEESDAGVPVNNETGFVVRRMRDYEKERSVEAEREVALHMPDFEIISDDLKLSWKYAVRALNTAENTGATDTACQIKDIIIGLSTTLEFCESMASLITLD